VQNDFTEVVSPFADMKPIETSLEGKHSEPSHYVTQEVYSIDKTQKLKSIVLRIPGTVHNSTAVEVPPYNWYTSLKHSVLAENDRRLLYWPYFDEDEDVGGEDLKKELLDRFEIVVEKREHQIERNEESKKYASYVEAFLEELGCTYEDVLYYLLQPNLDVPASIPLYDHELVAWTFRAKLCSEDYCRTSRLWTDVYDALPVPSDHSVVLAALACYVFQESCGRSLWHVAMKSNAVTRVLQHDKSGYTGNAASRSLLLRDIACRICYL